MQIPDQRVRLQASVTTRAASPRGDSWLEPWCRGRSSTGRALFLTWLTYIGVRHALDPDYMSPFYWLNFGIHEIGHVFTRPIVPHTVYVAAGTVVQYAVPVGAIFMFWRQKDLFAALPVCGVWISTNLYHTAWYVADARAQLHPSVPIFGEPTTSDWTYLLGRLGILTWDKGIASVLYVLAFILMWSSLAFGCCVVWTMYKLERRSRAS